ncbi:MAG: CPBP family intramembrane metalloprotease [Flavobacteriales bacterium]|mgnify:CR=1 FL=1|jgi:uncharacterized protein|nr:CPBP family intramembrane metalloprotease [Flavobacteriales bacterium]
MKKNSILPLALGTLLGFPTLAFIIHYFLFDTHFLLLFVSKSNLVLELIIGTISGVSFGYLAWLIISMPFMSSVFDKYKSLINTFELDLSLIFFVSFCAGFGEEILFRGVLQPHLGVWLTAIIFVAIHGYLNPKNWKISVYGIYLTVVIGVVGYLSQYFGLITAIISHMIIDVVLFYKLKENN